MIAGTHHWPAQERVIYGKPAVDALAEELKERGFERIVRWPRGVDTTLFKPDPDAALDLPRPIFLNVGRVAVEKNLEAFLALDLPGTKVVVGDGPARAALAKKYPQVIFTGIKEGRELAEIYAAADVFVFPSRTDTFGLVLLEALASGLPVASSVTRASQTWVVRPPWRIVASQASAPSVTVPRKFVFSSMVVKPRAPSGRLATVP